MSRLVEYRKQSDTRTGPSPAIWGTFGELKDWEYFAVFDDFAGLNADGNPYTLTEGDVGASVSQLATEENGVIRLTTGAVDNNEVNVSWAANAGAWGKFTASKAQWFEARFRTSSIADNENGIAIGLFEEASGGAGFQADNTGALPDKDYLVFRALQADGDGLDIEYNTASGGGATVHKNEAQVLVADTWYKVGWWYDGAKIRFYINGTKVGDDLEITATNFPDGEELVAVIGAKTGSAASVNLDIDWIRYAKER